MAFVRAWAEELYGIGSEEEGVVWLELARDGVCTQYASYCAAYLSWPAGWLAAGLLEGGERRAAQVLLVVVVATG
jgi:hypothetical protein